MSAPVDGRPKRRSGGFVSLACSAVLTALTGVGLGLVLLPKSAQLWLDVLGDLGTVVLVAVAFFSLAFGFYLVIPVALLAIANQRRAHVHPRTKIALWGMVLFAACLSGASWAYVRRHPHDVFGSVS